MVFAPRVFSRKVPVSGWEDGGGGASLDKALGCVPHGRGFESISTDRFCFQEELINGSCLETIMPVSSSSSSSDPLGT